MEILAAIGVVTLCFLLVGVIVGVVNVLDSLSTNTYNIKELTTRVRDLEKSK